MSNDSRRLAYLEALGVTAWQPRRDSALPEAALDDSVDAGGGVANEPPFPPERGPRDVAQLPEIQSQESQAPELQTQELRGPGAEIASLDWSGLSTAVAQCQRCPLYQGRTQGVLGVGNPQADWLFIGEAPGAEEDRKGEPFVGRAGQLLDAMLQAVGQSRERVYIANIIKSRPPGNRDPHPEEIQACLPYLHRQIQLIAPRLIMLVGRVSAQTMLDTSDPVGRLRGQVHRLPGSGIPAVVTYHPAYLLRSPLEKRKVWQDLRLARRTLETTP